MTTAELAKVEASYAKAMAQLCRNDKLFDTEQSHPSSLGDAFRAIVTKFDAMGECHSAVRFADAADAAAAAAAAAVCRVCRG